MNHSHPTELALGYLTAAETALLNYMNRLAAAETEAIGGDEFEIEVPDMIPLFGAVLLNIARAAGLIEAIVPAPDETLRRDYGSSEPPALPTRTP